MNLLATTMRRLPILTFAAALFLMISAPAAHAQFTSPFLFADEITTATTYAQDNLAEDAILVAGGTQGELQFEVGGFPVTVPGYDLETGESHGWLYVFYSPSTQETMAIAVARTLIAGTQVTEIDPAQLPRFDIDEIGVDGTYAGSEDFAEQLNLNTTFIEFRDEYPSSIPEALLIDQDPGMAAELVTDEFPLDVPVWAIYFNVLQTEDATDSSLICFMATTNGQTQCFRFESTDVPTSENARPATISAVPNPVSGKGTIALRIAGIASEPSEVALFGVDGRKALDVTDRAVRTADGSVNVLLDGGELAEGHYFVRVISTDGVKSASLIVE